MFNVTITRLTTQRDMQALIKTLFKIPEIDPRKVSEGLKVPPFFVKSFETELQAEELKTILEKLGAVCEIENTEAIPKDHSTEPSVPHASTPIPIAPVHLATAESAKQKVSPLPAKPKKRKSFLKKWRFWIFTFAIIAIFFVMNCLDCGEKIKAMLIQREAKKKEQVKEVKITGENEAQTSSKTTEKKEVQKNNEELKGTLVKNPYNAAAWKTLSENLQEKGDTAAAIAARDAYAKAIRAQMIMASLAKAFGNNVRAEISEDAVYYRTSKDFSDMQFKAEAQRLRDSLNTKMPEKDLVVENYTPSNKLQTIRIKPSYSREKDSPK